MLITDFILCYDHYRLLHPFSDPSYSKASRWSASRVGHNRKQLYLDCQAFLDFQREIYLCGSVRRTQLRVSPMSAGGLWKNLVSATNLPSWTRSTHTHTLELPRDDWRQRQLMQETECTERGAVDAKPHAFLCTMIILFVASIQSALLHLYIEECQTRAFVARCHTSVAKAVGEQGFIYASMTSDSSDCFTWLQCRKSIVSFLCEQLGRVGEQTNCIIWKEVMVFAW